MILRIGKGASIMTQAITTERELLSGPAGSRAWWFLGTLAVLRNPEGAPRTPAVIELTVPPGGSPPAHIHGDLDDAFLLLDGEVVVRCGEDVELVRAGSYVVMPHGVEHTFRVTSAKPAKLLLIHGDDSFLQFIEAVGTPTGDLRVPPPGTPTPDADQIARECEAHGARFVGPSLELEDIPSTIRAGLPDDTLGPVNHISLNVSDVTASERWYVDTFGLVRVDGEIAEDGHGHVVLLNPSAGWLLTLLGPTPPKVEHIAFTCDGREDVLRWRAILEERGARPGHITDAPYGSGFVVRDPDGIEMELFAPAPM
jgi:quercetin dioxygenase-like cupin family protein/catechol 2,3-dioxygenase-like lactoylglutathione lyase family enzyme